MATFTTGKEITSLVREYGISNVEIAVEETHTVRINFAEETESLRVYEIDDRDHAIRLAQKIADKFNVDLLLPSLVDEETTYDTFYNGSLYGVRHVL